MIDFPGAGASGAVLNGAAIVGGSGASTDYNMAISLIGGAGGAGIMGKLTYPVFAWENGFVWATHSRRTNCRLGIMPQTASARHVLSGIFPSAF